MKIQRQRALRGPNYYANNPVILMEVDLEELEEMPSDLIKDFKDRIHAILPGMADHFCSEGKPGGFYERIRRGTWAGHIAEHIALELQRLVGDDVTFGKTFTLKEKGLYHVVYRYKLEEVGLMAGTMAVEITNALFKGEEVPIEGMLEKLKEEKGRRSFGPSTQGIVDEAKKRGISARRLNNASYVQLGEGKYQRHIQATICDATSYLGVEIAGNKMRTKEILREHGIPVAKGQVVDHWEEAREVVKSMGYPVVVKPVNGNHGRGVTVGVASDEELQIAVDEASFISTDLLIEQQLLGMDYRVLLVDHKMVAAARREPAFVEGDGERSIKDLIEEVNLDPERGLGHEKNLTKIIVDSESLTLLKKNNYCLDTIPKKGEKVYLKATANLSTGGTATDVTDDVCPENVAMLEEVSRIIDLDIMGVDIVANTLAEPLGSIGGGIVEVNAAPGFRMHLHPTHGKSRNVAKAVVDYLFPEGAKHRLPLIAVTGTNGKTTTTRLLNHIFGHAGYQVGLTSTDGVFINNRKVLSGDYSGPAGAGAVLKDHSVDLAVLEVARGGILRRGLGYERSDAAIFLNISSDHLGEGGIHTLEELTRLKSTVVEAVGKDGVAILNADDERTYLRKDAIKSKIAWISAKNENPMLKESLANGSFNVVVKNETIVIETPDQDIPLAHVNDCPISFSGKARFNVENLLAAAAGAWAMGASKEDIIYGLTTFENSVELSPGRMNLFDVAGFKVLIDYGHNIGAIEATNEFVAGLAEGKKIRMTSGVGNRLDEDIKRFSGSLAKTFDTFVVCDASPRGREALATASVVKEGLLEAGVKEENIEVLEHERDAVQRCLSLAKPGDLVLLQVENIPEVTKQVMDFKKLREGAKTEEQ